MNLALPSFLSEALSRPSSIWEQHHIAEMSRLQVPPQLFFGRQELLQCDINHIWAQWFLECLWDPAQYTPGSGRRGYAFVYQAITQQVDALLPGIPRDERLNAAKTVARLVLDELRRREVRKRRMIDRERRIQLVDAVSPEIRCWICGYRFSSAAIDRFVNGNSGSLPLALFVDCFKPSGLRDSDRAIEVDHVVPYVAGGGEEENLALSCGWCNRHKGPFTSLYDQGVAPRVFHHPIAGPMSLPRPFWVVRLLGTRQRCEYSEGCSNTVRDCELTVMIRNRHGCANPANLTIVCPDHDEMADSRLVHRRLLGS